MALSSGLFENLHPGRRLVLEFALAGLCADAEAEAAGGFVSAVVLDSALKWDEALPQCVAMLVPLGREEDWLYSSEGGQWQLLGSAGASRMVIFFWHADEARSEASALQRGREEEFLKATLSRLVPAFCPKALFQHGVPVVPFVSYADDVVGRVIVEECYSPLTGFMVVEDVELEQGGCEVEGNGITSSQDSSVEELGSSGQLGPGMPVRSLLRRRLRFKRMPNLIQTEVGLHSSEESMFGDDEHTGKMGMRCVDHDRLVHRYLAPIVAGLVLVSLRFDACTGSEGRVKVLCVGVGGGALPRFLHRHLPSFEIQAVDLDEVVLRLARQHFDLVEDDRLHVRACDGWKLVVDLAEKVVKLGLATDTLSRLWQHEAAANCNTCLHAAELGHANTASGRREDPRFHVIVLDVDAADPKLGLSSPPTLFVEKRFLLSACVCLHQGGMLAINVIPSGWNSFQFLVDALKEVFAEVYAIPVEDGISQVVFALPSKLPLFPYSGPLSGQVEQLVDRKLKGLIYKI